MRINFKFLVYLFVTVGISSAQADSYVDYFRAVGVDNAGAVSELLARGFDPNTPDEYGQTGLILAMRDGAPKVAAALLAAPGLKVDTQNANGETALMMAALRGRMDWVQRLVERGASVNRTGWTAVHYAATGPDAKVLQWLLDRGGDINAASPNQSTPLMMAARYGSEDAVKLLLQRGADVKRRNERNLTAADFARLGGREALTAQLEALVR